MQFSQLIRHFDLLLLVWYNQPHHHPILNKHDHDHENLAFLFLGEPIISSHRLVRDDERMVKLCARCIVPALDLKCVLETSP